MLEIPHAGPAKGLLHGDAEQAERAQLRPEVPGKVIAAVDLGRARGDLRRREPGHGLAQQIGGLAETEIEGRRSAAHHDGSGSCSIPQASASRRPPRENGNIPFALDLATIELTGNAAKSEAAPHAGQSRNRVARPSKMKIPSPSVVVVRNGPAPTAGSMP